MPQCYEKLVRDRIPEIMEREGIRYEIEVLTEELYWEALRKKLVEEAHGLPQQGPMNLSMNWPTYTKFSRPSRPATGSLPMRWMP